MDENPYRAALRKGPKLRAWQVAILFPLLTAPLGLLWSWYMDGSANPWKALAFGLFGLASSLPFVLKAWLGR